MLSVLCFFLFVEDLSPPLRIPISPMTLESPGDSLGDGVGSFDLEYSCFGVRFGLGRGVLPFEQLGLFSMLRGFFFSDRLGIQVRTRVGPAT